MKKWEKILSGILLVISIFNVIKIVSCLIWISSTTDWIGGLGNAEIYILGVVVAILLQIASITLVIVGLKTNNKLDLLMYIAIVILVLTYFIPIYKYQILYPYNNLYDIAIF